MGLNNALPRKIGPLLTFRNYQEKVNHVLSRITEYDVQQITGILNRQQSIGYMGSIWDGIEGGLGFIDALRNAEVREGTIRDYFVYYLLSGMAITARVEDSGVSALAGIAILIEDDEVVAEITFLRKATEDIYG